MAILKMQRDWGADPSIVRIVTDDNFATITANGYLTRQAANIQAINYGQMAWVDTDYCLIFYNGGSGYFIPDFKTNFTFVPAPAEPGSVPIPDAQILVGNAAGVGTPVPVSGDVTLDNTGNMDVVSTQPASVNLASLTPEISPVGVIKFAGQQQTVGGAAVENFNLPGALDTDLPFVQLVDAGTNDISIKQVDVVADTLSVTFSADPGNDAFFNYQIIRDTV